MTLSFASLQSPACVLPVGLSQFLLDNCLMAEGVHRAMACRCSIANFLCSILKVQCSFVGAD
jgi:hypothetical protein